jgi:SAM-dependent methyltransferase
LVESAPLAHRTAGELCAIDPATGDSCAWYHGFWQYLRAMRLTPTLGDQGDFLMETLGPLARSGDHARVFVSGCADYSLPAHVLHAYERERAPLTLTVVDRCETPLFLTRWYAERRGGRVATTRRDLLEYVGPASVDVIVANSFLGYFDPDGRARLYAAWARLLRPGGILVCSNRLRLAAEPGLVGFTPTQADAFVAAARAEAERWVSVFGFDLEEVTAWARAYAERFRSHPVRSADELATDLQAAGFDLGPFGVATVPGDTGGGPLAAPSVSGAAVQLRVVARSR